MFKKTIFIILSHVIILSAFGQNITLNTPNKNIGKPLMQTLSERKSSRNFIDKNLSINTLSNLLWAANGFNREDKRTAPTANNKQEIELYVVIKSGSYRYDAKANKLILIKSGDHRKETGNQDFVASASANIIIVADMNKASSENYAYTNCGFVAQNIYLFAASEGLGAVARGWYDGDKLSKLLDLPSSKKVLLTQSVGIIEE